MDQYAPGSPIIRETQSRDEAMALKGLQGARALGTLLVVGAAFTVYLLTALYLGARGGISYFGADPDYYLVLQYQAVDHTAARFHPSTFALGLGWMKLFSPIEGWIAPHVLLKAMFAAIGSVGVLAAILASSVLLPRGYALLGGIIYASSLGVWYFAAIPESKILTASLATLYIAVYALYRQYWTVPRTFALNAILAVACLNEIVSAFLIAIPAIDALQRGIVRQRVRWLVVQVLVVLAAWFVLEFIVNGCLISASPVRQYQSHFGLLLHYIMKQSYSLPKLHDFVANWFFFNLVAPTPFAQWWPVTGGYFEANVAAYRWSPIAMTTVLVVAAMIAASLLPRVRAASLGPAGGLLLPLAVYALVRAAFFIIFVPDEALLFSPAVTLAHWLIVLVPFTASRFPAKGGLLAALCVLLIATNASFMLGPAGVSGLTARLFGP